MRTVLAILAVVALVGAHPTLESANTENLDNVNIVARSTSAVPASLVDDFKKYMMYSAAAYCDSVIVRQQWSCDTYCASASSNTQVVEVFGDGESGVGFLGVQSSAKIIVAAFRGSNDAGDWSINLNFILKPAAWLSTAWGSSSSVRFMNGSNFQAPNNAKVHAGFQNSYMVAREEVLTVIQQTVAKYPDYQIIFTGHSLGAAVASLAAVDYIDKNPSDSSKVSLYTYGSPRIGNKAFADWYSTIPFRGLFRITRTKDPVPHLPPQAFTYRHFKQEYLIDADGNTKSCTNNGDAGETSDCADVDYFPPQIRQHLTGYYYPSGCLKEA
ncbi:hypothetical protein BATDEDRAFT_91713 [Batrachochytrium dendrobatidis JAM81]|uniref:Fungal lipase-type domain-containing protein n=2 Tax=Batrachochytrium dendrobatidis TaxID=109871 RepID=F4PBS1_BATDJ|nr:uncharacterized protein BATDEDRAFT_91713 [Batrachochytrium dendrobatidis JAM81]EGF77492.1 hypothetical protein BATDEDRAFT_91713 [Batrachochytrium dendrobatidis JAM81]KAJ8327533.1 hypothetical protein O5D80_003890 [Batrachochytrium dendrobatidis]KAK5669170.1 hypothetical protein QVD99_003580 [Batrachochytrium dendrobatidis]OAJ37703.1 hypothetical protein BDEG_21699 [Batrachochytrium dendrobatidis JEL423]|eukprot:XP_006682097.1 hypothetical protein BATDEDRAFT_91713 [Batrachochytrium dendrobatidis JAM81]